ncbi:hypothetical protein LZ31DRAFT_257090 [Colletotrichum somersetense]|nr:hypothetical protein LZ31DRAFT_257090 [Colletotrichum somersetense]
MAQCRRDTTHLASTRIWFGWHGMVWIRLPWAILIPHAARGLAIQCFPRSEYAVNITGSLVASTMNEMFPFEFFFGNCFYWGVPRTRRFPCISPHQSHLTHTATQASVFPFSCAGREVCGNNASVQCHLRADLRFAAGDDTDIEPGQAPHVTQRRPEKRTYRTRVDSLSRSWPIHSLIN